tara:strand:+ start:4074 stop:5270 length:1197 start_codon:yes stop_codon:yes gene_type:complete
MATTQELIALFGDDFNDVLKGLSALPPEAREILDQAMGKMIFDAEVFDSRVRKAVQTQTAAGISREAIKAGLLTDMNTGGAVFGEIRNSIKGSLVEGINQSGRAGQFQALDPDASTLFTWVTVAGHKICQDCAPRGGLRKTLKEWESEGLPGTGWSVCKGHCHCILDPSGKISPRIAMENIKNGKLVKGAKVKTGGVIEFTDYKRGDKEIEKYYNKALNDREKSAVDFYSQNGYSYLNKARYLDEITAENDMLVRNGFTTKKGKKIKGAEDINAWSQKNIIDPLSKAPNFKGTVYRGEAISGDALKWWTGFGDNLVGDIHTVKAFWSTSASKKTAGNFGRGGARITYIIQSKKGKILNGLSNFRHESEVLFMPNSKFKIDKVLINDSGRDIKVSLTEI